ncbi:dihydrolipoyl dehydrogenase [Virgibacillus salexigens]|uniref:dihydrolipoyl dehydrogenase n=1 Tax=Virgibacillus massiliensis TaxID=1462526 RepID=UPI00136D8812|nr:dihydrolipoyl dehydrogenase [Virgibacillus massiliensis]MYL43471.1 dihydrolipoyl dehydrogenase [Virgibacillus massiliensis]
MVVGEFAEQRELIIIGGGPGGYHAAIRAARLGLQVTMIEQEHLGGVCLNKGCVPSKVFANAAKHLDEVKHLSSFGISAENLSFQIHQLVSYKEQTMQQLRAGVEKLCKTNQIEVIHGRANFINEHRIGVEMEHRFELFEFKQAIISTGRSPILPNSLMGNPRIMTEQTIFNLNEVPEELVVYGADYIALEAAFSYRKMGSKVSIVLNNRADFPFDHAINRELKRILKKEKIHVYREYQLKQVTPRGDRILLQLTKHDNQLTLAGTHLYVETNHQPNIDSLGIDQVGIQLSEAGFIAINQEMKTTIPSVFAIGDVTDGVASAVKAMKQGKVAAEIAAGLSSEVDLTMIPTVVHSIPPIAVVGLTEQAAEQQGYHVKTSQFGYVANSYATISNQTDGIAKVIKDADSDLLLGFHTIGAGAIELISTGVTALELVGRDEDLSFPLYPHPSFNETILEAIEGLTDKAIHIKPKNKPLDLANK